MLFLSSTIIVDGTILSGHRYWSRATLLTDPIWTNHQKPSVTVKGKSRWVVRYIGNAQTIVSMIKTRDSRSVKEGISTRLIRVEVVWEFVALWLSISGVISPPSAPADNLKAPLSEFCSIELVRQERTRRHPEGFRIHIHIHIRLCQNDYDEYGSWEMWNKYGSRLQEHRLMVGT